MSGAQENGDRPDVLSITEEDVLVGLRGLLASVRARGADNELGRLTEALVSAGAAIVDGAGAGPVELTLGDVAFSLRASAEGIEVRFPGAAP
jgi:hypothetical protein